VLLKLDVAAFEQALTRWITDVLGQLPDREGPHLIAVDGKSLRGSWDRFGQAVYLLMAIDQRTSCVLHQQAVPDRTNEHKTSLLMLQELVLTGRIVTLDAAFCQQDVCQTIVDSGGHYVIPVKDNQPTLQSAIASEFAAENAVFSPL